jgi:hypothetical protein
MREGEKRISSMHIHLETVAQAAKDSATSPFFVSFTTIDACRKASPETKN